MKKLVKTQVGNALGEQRCSSLFEEKKVKYCSVISAPVRDKLPEHSFSFQNFAISH